MTHNHCALFLPSLSIGGAERMMLNIAIGLSEMDYKVDLVLVNAKGSLLNDVPENINLVDLNASRVLTSVPGLVKYLYRERPDVLLSTITPTNVVATWAHSLPGIGTKHVVRVARPESVAAAIQENSYKERITATLARICYPLADDIIAISNSVATDVRENSQIDEQQLHVIYNPTVTKELLKQAEEPVEHPWFNTEVPVILGVGRFVDQKDFETLIKSFSLLREKRDARLVIFGDGEKREILEQLVNRLEISNSISMPGFTDNPYKYMANADVFVNSAIHEGFGNVIIEAMACGCPVVATDCPGAPSELLEGGKFGQLVPPRSPKKMLTAINNMIDSPTSKELLYKRSQDFSLDTAVESYENVLFNI